MRALTIAASGMNAQQLNLEVISHNIANINTTSFKRDRAEFTDLLYQIERAAGAPVRGGEASVPEGARIGLGVRVAAVRSLHQQGALAATSNKLDLAINGDGWFQIAGPNSESLYTRAGSFNINADRQLVTIDGYLVQPTITFPDDAVEVIINETGQVTVTILFLIISASTFSRMLTLSGLPAEMAGFLGGLGLGLGGFLAGYLLLRTGSITAAPLLLVVGYCVMVPLSIVLWARKSGSKEGSETGE